MDRHWLPLASPVQFRTQSVRSQADLRLFSSTSTAWSIRFLATLQSTGGASGTCASRTSTQPSYARLRDAGKRGCAGRRPIASSRPWARRPIAAVVLCRSACRHIATKACRARGIRGFVFRRLGPRSLTRWSATGSNRALVAQLDFERQFTFVLSRRAAVGAWKHRRSRAWPATKLALEWFRMVRCMGFLPPRSRRPRSRRAPPARPLAESQQLTANG